MNGTTTNTTRKLITNGCDRGVYNWCDSTPVRAKFELNYLFFCGIISCQPQILSPPLPIDQATNVYVYHVALILCLGLAMPVGQVRRIT